MQFRYDPPVPDGTSLSGPFGKDNRYTPNLTVKADTPGNLFDWQKKVRKLAMPTDEFVMGSLRAH